VNTPFSRIAIAPHQLPRFRHIIVSLFLSFLSVLNATPYFLSPIFAQTTQDRKSEADKLRLKGIQQYQANQFKRAFESWEKSLAIYREIKDRLGEARSLHNLGLGYSLIGLHQKAIAFLQESLTITRELKDIELEAKSLGSLGDGYYYLGEYPKALESYQKVVQIYKEIGDRNCASNTKNEECITTRRVEESIHKRIEKTRDRLKK
jgi:tetratricopeptide (TPR) repeat protein